MSPLKDIIRDCLKHPRIQPKHKTPGKKKKKSSEKSIKNATLADILSRYSCKDTGKRIVSNSLDSSDKTAQDEAALLNFLCNNSLL